MARPTMELNAGPGAIVRASIGTNPATELLSLVMSLRRISAAAWLMPSVAWPALAMIGVKLIVLHCRSTAEIKSVELMIYDRAPGNRRV